MACRDVEDDDVAIPGLCERLHDTDSDVRRRAVGALSWITVWENEKNDFKAAPALVKAIPALVDVLEHDHDESIRADAAKVLGRIGPRASAAVPALRDATKDQSAWVRSEAGEALTKVLANRQPPAKDERQCPAAPDQPDG